MLLHNPNHRDHHHRRTREKTHHYTSGFRVTHRERHETTAHVRTHHALSEKQLRLFFANGGKFPHSYEGLRSQHRRYHAPVHTF